MIEVGHTLPSELSFPQKWNLGHSPPQESKKMGDISPCHPQTREAGRREELPLCHSSPWKALSTAVQSPLPNLALPPAFSLRKEDTSPQTQTGTDGHFVMQMRAPAQRTKLQPRGKGAGPFPADKSKKGGALKMTLPLPHPLPALRRKSNRAQGPPSGFLSNNSKAHTSP